MSTSWKELPLYLFLTLSNILNSLLVLYSGRFDRTISTRKETVVETNVSSLGLDADEAPRAKRSSPLLSLPLYFWFLLMVNLSDVSIACC